jgi:dolichyl-phosphate beta-glucosyltransferase
MNNPFLSIIIPARNEECRLPRTLEQVVEFLGRQTFKAEVIVVVNASTDQTLEIAQKFSFHYPLIKVIDERLPGKGRAVRTGMLAARGAYRLFTDADLSVPIKEINRFISSEGNKTIVIASREAPGAVRYGEPFYRHIIGRIFNKMIRLLILPGLQDTQCGFKMFRGDIADDLFTKQTLTGLSFDVELLYLAMLRGYPIYEIPIPWHYTAGNKVKILRDSWCMFFDLLKIRRNKQQGQYT